MFGKSSLILSILLSLVPTTMMAVEPIIGISFDKGVQADFGGVETSVMAVSGLQGATGMTAKLHDRGKAVDSKTLADDSRGDGLVGKAFPVGTQENGSIYSLVYSPTPRLSAKEGAVSLWVKPETWNGEEKAEFRHFFSARQGNHMLIIYKYLNTTDLFLVYGTHNQNNGVVAKCNVRSWKTGEWHHIGANWTPEAIELFVDGRSKAITPIKSTLPEDFRFIMLGEYWKGNPGRTMIDEVRVFNKRLSADDMEVEYNRLSDKLEQSRLPAVMIGCAKATPTLDGRIQPGEYPAVFGGMRDIVRKNTFALTQAVCRFAWDEDFLYCAVSSPDRNRVATQTGRDSAVYLDDSVELHLKTKEHLFQFLFNTKDASLDHRDENFTWNAESLKSVSSFEPGVWHLEFRVAWKDLGITPKDGSKLRFNLTRSYLFNKESTQVAPAWKRYADEQHFGEITLLEQAPAFDVSNLGDLSQYQLDCHLNASSSIPTKIRFKLDADATMFSFNTNQVFDLQPGKPLSHSFKRMLPPDNTLSCLLEIPEGPILYRAQLDYTTPESIQKWYLYTDLPKNELVFVMRNKNLNAPDSSLRLQFVKPDGTIAKTVVNSVPAKEPIVHSRFPLEGLAAGRYELRYELMDAKGKVFFSDMEEFEYFKDGAYWDNIQDGLEETVPPPWTAVQATDDTFSCWGRTVRLGGQGLVSSIQTQGRELLASPIQLLVNGKPVQFQVERKSIKDTTATFRLVPVGQPCPLELQVTGEFDGFMLFTGTISPGARVDSLTLEFPLVRKLTDAFDDCASPHYKNSLQKDTEFSINAFSNPFFWCGCNEVGLMGGTATKRGWHVRDKVNSMRVAAGTAETRLTLRIADTSFTAGPQGNVFSFYLNPTPVKPLRLFDPPVRDRHNMFIGGTSSRFFYYYHPDYMTDFWKWVVRRTKHDGRISPDKMNYMSYQSPKGTSPMSPAWNYYCQDWVNPVPELGNYSGDVIDISKREVRNRGSFTYGCLNSKSFFDHQLMVVKNAMDGAKWDQWDARNLYFDLGWPRTCGNPYHGCYWQDEFGDNIRDNDLLPLRQYYIRVLRMIQKKTPDGWMMGHVYHTRTPSDNFFDIILVGEMYDSKVVKRLAYYDVLNPELLRIAYTTRCNEMTVALGPQFLRCQELFAPEKAKFWDPLTKQNDRAVRHFLAYTTMFGMTHVFDVWTKGQQLVPPGKGQVDIWHTAMAKLGINGRKVEYKGSVSPDLPMVLHAVITGKGKTMLIVLNDTEQPHQFSVAAPAACKNGRDIFNGHEYNSTNGQFSMEMDARESAFILFE